VDAELRIRLLEVLGDGRLCDPHDLKLAVNTVVGETRPSLSWDAGTFYLTALPGLKVAATSTSRPETSSKGQTTREAVKKGPLAGPLSRHGEPARAYP
jgi:hypothetical protein